MFLFAAGACLGVIRAAAHRSVRHSRGGGVLRATPWLSDFWVWKNRAGHWLSLYYIR